MPLTVLITDTNLRPVMAPVRWTSFDATLKHNDTGSGSFTAPAYDELRAAIQPGRRVTTIWDGQVLISGPIEKPGPYAWAAADQQTGGRGQVTITFADNVAYLGWRRVYPNPAVASTAQNLDAYAPGATNAETLMRNLVNLNAGAGALAERRIPNLALGTLVGTIGADVTISSRFDVLPDVLRQVAISGGGLGFRIRDTMSQLLFEVYQPVDRSGNTPGALRFARRLGNLRGESTDPQAPTATVAIVGGDGDGAARIIIERANMTAVADWGRIETFVDQSGVTDTTALQQYGDQSLVQADESIGLTIDAVGAGNLAYGSAYQLGDLAAVELPSGLTVPQPITSVHVTAAPDTGVKFQPGVGSSDPITDNVIVALLRDLQRRVGRLERT